MCILYLHVSFEGGGVAGSTPLQRLEEAQAFSSWVTALVRVQACFSTHTSRGGDPVSTFLCVYSFQRYNSTCFMHTTTTHTIRDVFGIQNFSNSIFQKTNGFFTLGAELLSTMWCLLLREASKTQAMRNQCCCRLHSPSTSARNRSSSSPRLAQP